jgi:hypothetical protein
MPSTCASKASLSTLSSGQNRFVQHSSIVSFTWLAKLVRRRPRFSNAPIFAHRLSATPSLKLKAFRPR